MRNRSVWRTFSSAVLCFAMAGCADRNQMPVLTEEQAIGTPHTVFIATNREQADDGTFGPGRSQTLTLMEATVSIPKNHAPGDLSYRHRNPDPERDFTIADLTRVTGVRDLASRLAREQRQNRWSEREVTIFVHGYNSTLPEVAYRAAQIAHDVDLPGSLLMYAWPSRGRTFGYAYDLESMLFARNDLEQVIRDTKAAGATRIILVAHSMGTALTMEMLRQSDFKDPGWAARTLDSVLLIAPDLSVDLFESQIRDLSHVPQPFGVIVSEKDAVLRLSAMLRGNVATGRLGNIASAQRLKDLPVEIIDITEFASDATAGHFVAATSPSLIAMIRSTEQITQSFEAPQQTFLGQLFPPSRASVLQDGKIRISRSEDR